MNDLAHTPALPAHLYRHYKGGTYVVIIVAVNEATQEPLVVYRSVENGAVWARLLTSFEDPRVSDEHPVPRFTLLGPVQGHWAGFPAESEADVAGKALEGCLCRGFYKPTNCPVHGRAGETAT